MRCPHDEAMSVVSVRTGHGEYRWASSSVSAGCWATEVPYLWEQTAVNGREWVEAQPIGVPVPGWKRRGLAQFEGRLWTSSKCRSLNWEETTSPMTIVTWRPPQDHRTAMVNNQPIFTGIHHLHYLSFKVNIFSLWLSQLHDTSCTNIQRLDCNYNEMSKKQRI